MNDPVLAQALVALDTADGLQAAIAELRELAVTSST
jgi:hypothetical protein